MKSLKLIALLAVGTGVGLAVLHSDTIRPPAPVVKPMLLWEKSAGPRRSRIYVAFSPDGRYLATSTNKGGISIWDPETGKLLRTMHAPNGSASHIAFSPDSKYLAVSGQVSSLLDVRTGKPARKLQHGEARTVSFSPDGKLLAAGGDRITVWDLQSGRIVRRLGRSGDLHSSAQFSPSGAILAYADHQKLHDCEYLHRTRLWDVRRGKVSHTLDGTTGCYAFSPDERILAAAATGSSGMRMWDVETGRRLKTFVSWREIGSPCAADFSPDGKLIAVGGSAHPYSRWAPYYHALLGSHPPKTAPGGMITLSDVQTGRIMWKEKVSRIDIVFSVDISPDGKFLAAGVSWDAKVIVWQIR